jgi:hypothetical protein
MIKFFRSLPFVFIFSIVVFAQTGGKIHAPLFIAKPSNQIALVSATTVLYHYSPIARLSGRAPPLNKG